MVSEGTKIVRRGRHYKVKSIGEREVAMTTSYAGSRLEVSETRRRFDEEVASGRAVVHPDCEYCGLPVRPDDAMDDDDHDVLHHGCWFQLASVRDRCVDACAGPGWPSSMACRALRSGDPRQWLLDYIGDPVHSFDDRCTAEHLLSHAVDSETIIEHQVRCPECREGEVFRIDPETGEVSCHCGKTMKEPDDA